jgi:hypothetical protein
MTVSQYHSHRQNEISFWMLRALRQHVAARVNLKTVSTDDMITFAHRLQWYIRHQHEVLDY